MVQIQTAVFQLGKPLQTQPYRPDIFPTDLFQIHAGVAVQRCDQPDDDNPAAFQNLSDIRQQCYFGGVIPVPVVNRRDAVYRKIVFSAKRRNVLGKVNGSGTHKM